MAFLSNNEEMRKYLFIKTEKLIFKMYNMTIHYKHNIWKIMNL